MTALHFRRLGIGPSGPVVVERADGSGGTLPPVSSTVRALRRLTREGTRLLRCDRAGIWRVGPDGTGPVCLTRFTRDSGRHDEMLAHPDAMGRHTVEILERIAFLSMDDVQSAAPPAPPLRRYLESEGVRALLAVPIRVGGTLRGFQTFENCSAPKRWNGEDRARARELAQQVEMLWERERSASSTGLESTESGRDPEPANWTSDESEAPVVVRTRNESALDLGLRRLGTLEAAGVLGLDLARSVAGLLEVQAGLLGLESEPGENRTDGLREAVVRARDRLVRYRRWARNGRMEHTSIELNSLLGGIAARLGKVAGEDVGLVLAPSARTLRVEGESALLSDALEHLVRNAREASSAGDRVRIGVTAIRGPDGLETARIVVEDRGEGIARGNLPWIFEPWFTTRRQRGAEGIGLSVVQAVIEGHGGWVDVTSTVGGGTRVALHLPLRSDVESNSRGEHPAPDGEPDHGPRALILSDGHPVSGLVEGALRRAGFQVTRVRGRSEAEAALLSGDEVPLVVLAAGGPDEGVTAEEIGRLAAGSRSAPPVLLVDPEGFGTDETDDGDSRFRRLCPPLDPDRIASVALELIEAAGGAGSGAADPGPGADGAVH